MAATYYLLRGIEPPDLKVYPDSIRVMYWEWVVEAGLKAKESELARGLDKDGKALRPIRASTRRHRKSAMTPSGRGDPSAPPLMPGRGLSRTRSLLAGRARRNYAEFYWRYDAHTGDQWGVILGHQAKKGRDVIGLSPEATRKVQAAALVRWQSWKRGHVEADDIPRRQVASMRPKPLKVIPAPEPVMAGPSPWRTRDEWEKHFREPVPRVKLRNPRGTAPSVRRGPISRLLSFLWGA